MLLLHLPLSLVRLLFFNELVLLLFLLLLLLVGMHPVFFLLLDLLMCVPHRQLNCPLLALALC